MKLEVVNWLKAHLRSKASSLTNNTPNIKCTHRSDSAFYWTWCDITWSQHLMTWSHSVVYVSHEQQKPRSMPQTPVGAISALAFLQPGVFQQSAAACLAARRLPGGTWMSGKQGIAIEHETTMEDRKKVNLCGDPEGWIFFFQHSWKQIIHTGSLAHIIWNKCSTNSIGVCWTHRLMMVKKMHSHKLYYFCWKLKSRNKWSLYKKKKRETQLNLFIRLEMSQIFLSTILKFPGLISEEMQTSSPISLVHLVF